MTQVPQMNREEAVERLKAHGIRGAQIYLIDIIPLIEMIWADGHVQDSEVAILDSFVKEHVARINKMAGYEVLTMDAAKTFVERFLKERPNSELLKTLRSLIAPIRMTCSDEKLKDVFRDTLLASCLDIASSCVTEYPYKLCDRFNPAEKRCFFEILESLE